MEVAHPVEAQLNIEMNPDLTFSPKLSEPISKFLTEIQKLIADAFSVILISPSLSQAEKLSQLLREQEIFPAESEDSEEFYHPVWSLAIAVGELFEPVSASPSRAWSS